MMGEGVTGGEGVASGGGMLGPPPSEGHPRGRHSSGRFQEDGGRQIDRPIWLQKLWRFCGALASAYGPPPDESTPDRSLHEVPVDFLLVGLAPCA
jgi:hypothetical protein